MFRKDRPGISINVERKSYEKVYWKREITRHGCVRFPQPVIKDQTAELASTALKGHIWGLVSFMTQLISFYFNGSPISGWSIGFSSSQSADQLLTSGPRFCVSPAQPFCSFSLFSSFILLSCLHLQSSSVLINTVSLVINNYVKGSKRCHLLERDCMYTTKWHAHLNYL